MDAVFSSRELSALIAERAFDPYLSFTIRQLAAGSPVAWHDLATLASLARVNRALSRSPWPAAAGMAHVALGHAAEATRRRLAPNVASRSPAALATRAAIQAKLEAGLAVVARACDALHAELDGAAGAEEPGASIERATCSAAERAYRACLLFSAVDALWRSAPAPRGFALLPEPPPHEHAHELRAAALSTCVAVLGRLAHVVDPQRALREAGPWRRPTLPARQLERLDRVGAELVELTRALYAAIDGSSADWWLGPLGLALMGVLDDDDSSCNDVITHGYARLDVTLMAPGAMCVPHVLFTELVTPLCRLFADAAAPVGARSCAAAALERHARGLRELYFEETSVDVPVAADALIADLDASGATGLYRALRTEVDRARPGGNARRGRRGGTKLPALVMPASRAHLLSAARKLARSVDDELRELVEEARYEEMGGSD